MEKNTVLLLLDSFIGPIDYDDVDESGNGITNIPVIDKDETIAKLAGDIRSLWRSLFTTVDYSEDNPAGYVFDEARAKELAPELLRLGEALVARLDEVNDGTFVVTDWLTSKLRGLIE